MVSAGRLEIRYRILGSMHDAEDALQETLVSAWRGLSAYDSARRCARGCTGSRPIAVWTHCAMRGAAAAGTRAVIRSAGADADGEVSWLEPYPDALLEGIIDTTPGPEARYETRETSSSRSSPPCKRSPRGSAPRCYSATCSASTPPRSRACSTTSEDSVKGALKRARSTIDRLSARNRDTSPAAGLTDANTNSFDVSPTPGSPTTSTRSSRYSPITRGSACRRPRSNTKGIQQSQRCLRAITSRRGRRRYTLIPTRANAQPAFGRYRPTKTSERARRRACSC